MRGVEERHQAQRPEPRPERSDRKVGKPKQLRDGGEVGDHRIDLFGADHGDGDDRGPRPDRRGDEPAPAEPPQAVAVLEALARAAHTLRKDKHELITLEQPPRVVGMPDRLSRPSQKPAQHRHAHEHARDQRTYAKTAALIIVPSHGRTPPWFATSSARPLAGTFSMPVVSTRQ